MSIREDLKILLVKECLTLKQLAEIISVKKGKKITASNISHKLTRNTMKYGEFKEIIEALGYKIELVKK